jgi:uncharacterized protein with NRDE domain
MCLIFLAIKKHPVYKLIIAANRDEFYQRQTAPAEFWLDDPNVLGGRDLEAGGSWLAMTKGGKISMVTNYRDPKNINPNAPSRGHLVSDYLQQEVDAETYLTNISWKGKQYNGFNLITGDLDNLWYYSNYQEGVHQLGSGVFGLSNHLLETPWPKIVRGKEKFSSAVSSEQVSPETLFNLLYDDVIAEDSLLPNTGIGIERERVLSSMFIKSSGYGTRCSTVILADYSNRVTFQERIYNTATFDFSTRNFSF